MNSTAEKPLVTTNGLSTFDAAGMYRQEGYTDKKHGVITVLTPVDRYGARDPDRKQQFYGSVTLAWRNTPIVVEFELTREGGVSNLGEAIEVFIACATAAGEARVADLDRQAMQYQLRGGIVGAGGLPMGRPN